MKYRSRKKAVLGEAVKTENSESVQDSAKLKNGLIYDNTAGGWVFMKDGCIDTLFTGIADNENGSWFIVNGRVNFDVNGFIEYRGIKYYVEKNKILKTPGFSKIDGVWYFIEQNGMIARTGIATDLTGHSYYVKNGACDFSVSGIITNIDGDGRDYYIEKGVLKTGISETRQINGITYYIDYDGAAIRSECENY